MDGEQNISGTPPELSQAIDKLLANPGLISMVASALSGASSAEPSEAPNSPIEAPVLAPDTTREDAQSSSDSGGVDPAALMTSLAPLLSGLSTKAPPPDKPDDHRACLLRALKPYVSPGRREAIDYMIRFSQITDLLKRMG